jgi:hypothetical protein
MGLSAQYHAAEDLFLRLRGKNSLLAESQEQIIAALWAKWNPEEGAISYLPPMGT